MLLAAALVAVILLRLVLLLLIMILLREIVEPHLCPLLLFARAVYIIINWIVVIENLRTCSALYKH